MFLNLECVLLLYYWRWMERTEPFFLLPPLTQTSLLQTQVRKSAPSRGWSRGDRTIPVRRPPSPPRSRNPVPAAATPPLTPVHSAPFSAKLFHQVQTHPVRLAFLHSFFFLSFFFFFLSRPYIFSGVAQVCFSALIVVCYVWLSYALRTNRKTGPKICSI